MHTPEGDPPLEQPADQPRAGEAREISPDAPLLSADSPTISSDVPAAYPNLPHLDPNLPPDLRTPLNGMDLLVLAMFYFIAGAAISLLLIFAATRVFGLSRDALQNSAGAKASLVIVSQALLSGAMFALLFGMVRSRGTEDFWPSVGWRPFPGKGPRIISILRYVIGGVILAGIIGWISSYLDRNLVLPMEELLHNRQSVLLLTGLGVLVAPLFEETLFRGCIYPVIARRWGVGTSVLVTGILFGSAHAPQLWPGYGQIALLIVVGIVLTYVRARTDTVAASYFVHLGYNSIFFAGFYFATGGLKHLPS